MNVIPLFPLKIVVFPDEKIPLHIFEDRYQQLIKDCEEGKLNFGIPSVINGEISFGNEIVLKKVVKRYENGEEDIVCYGKRIFKIDQFYNPLPHKLYAGGEVTYFENVNDGEDTLKHHVVELMKEFYAKLELELPEIDVSSFISYNFAHRIGLSQPQEYRLLQLFYENERLQYIIDHLETIIPIIREINNTRDVIKFNGHFRSFDPMDFKDVKWE